MGTYTIGQIWFAFPLTLCLLARLPIDVLHIKYFKLVKCLGFFICFNASTVCLFQCGERLVVNKASDDIPQVAVSEFMCLPFETAKSAAKKSNWPTFYSLKIASWGRRKVSTLRVVPIFPHLMDSRASETRARVKITLPPPPPPYRDKATRTRLSTGTQAWDPVWLYMKWE